MATINKERETEGMDAVVGVRRNAKDLISNIITEMICQDCNMSAIMDAVTLSKMFIDDMKKEK
jgi:hypothetical protein